MEKINKKEGKSSLTITHKERNTKGCSSRRRKIIMDGNMNIRKKQSNGKVKDVNKSLMNTNYIKQYKILWSLKYMNKNV